MMKKLKMKRLTVVSMLVATMSILWVDSISINGVSKSNIVRNADSVDTENNLGDSSEINVTAVSNLMGKIMGETSPKSYDELKTYMISTEGNVRTGEQIGTQVILGGYTWNVVYSSLTGTSETLKMATVNFVEVKSVILAIENVINKSQMEYVEWS